MAQPDRYPVLTCIECGAEIEPGAEDSLKLFKFHVKREHKRRLNQNESYRPFLSDEDWQVVKDDGRV
jgi:hypothetical protein